MHVQAVSYKSVYRAYDSHHQNERIKCHFPFICEILRKQSISMVITLCSYARVLPAKENRKCVWVNVAIFLRFSTVMFSFLINTGKCMWMWISKCLCVNKFCFSNRPHIVHFYNFIFLWNAALWYVHLFTLRFSITFRPNRKLHRMWKMCVCSRSHFSEEHYVQSIV